MIQRPHLGTAQGEAPEMCQRNFNRRLASLGALTKGCAPAARAVVMLLNSSVILTYTNGLKPAGLFISFASAKKKRIKEKGAFAASSSCACFSSHPPSSAVVSSHIASEPSNLTKRLYQLTFRMRH